MSVDTVSGTVGARILLEWLISMGADAVVSENPCNWLETPPPSIRSAPYLEHQKRDLEHQKPALDEKFISATPVLSASLEDLRAELLAFEGCALKKTATRLVFGDGNVQAPLMIIGEAPGADEDREGRPFVGVSGQLLDRMLGFIGLSRTSSNPQTAFYITNIIPWRPPGNRQPSPMEIASCLPFIYRHIALVKPRLLLLVGGTSAKSLTKRPDGIMRLRGCWYELDIPGISTKIPALTTFHPAFLLRQPARKADAWADLLVLKQRLDKN